MSSPITWFSTISENQHAVIVQAFDWIGWDINTTYAWILTTSHDSIMYSEERDTASQNFPKILILFNYDTCNKSFVRFPNASCPCQRIGCDRFFFIGTLWLNFRGTSAVFHLLLVPHTQTHTTNAVMPFFDRVSVHFVLQVLLNVLLQLFAVLLACLSSYVPSIAFAISVSMAVSPRVQNREGLNGFFLLNLILRTVIKFVGTFQSWLYLATVMGTSHEKLRTVLRASWV